MKKLKVYLDTCIINRLLDISNIEDNTLKKSLEKIIQNSKIEIVTSKKTLEEINNTKEKSRRENLIFVYKILKKIKKSNYLKCKSYCIGDGAIGMVGIGGMNIEINSVFQKLLEVFDENDAEQIFHALKARCNVFLTVDYNTILNRIENYLALSEMKILDPQNFVKELN